MGIKFTDTFAIQHGNIYSFLETELKIKCRDYNSTQSNKKSVSGLDNILKYSEEIPKKMPIYRPIAYLMVAKVLKIDMDDKDNIRMRLSDPHS